MSERVEQGVAVRAARVAKRMTQAHLAVAAGVSEKTVRRAEGGDRIGPESLRAVCAVLGLDATALSTEAECVPDAAAEARRRLDERKRRAALLVGVLTASLAATSAWTVFDAGDAVQVAYMLASWGAVSVLITVAAAVMLNAGRVALRASVEASAREVLADALRPVAFARRATGGLGDVLAALRVACLPPAVLAAMYALKVAVAEPSVEVGLGALVIVSVAWWIARAAVEDASGLGEGGGNGAAA